MALKENEINKLYGKNYINQLKQQFQTYLLEQSSQQKQEIQLSDTKEIKETKEIIQSNEETKEEMKETKETSQQNEENTKQIQRIPIKEILLQSHYLPLSDRIWKNKPGGNDFRIPDYTITNMILPYCVPLIVSRENIISKQTMIQNNSTNIIKQLEKVNKAIPSKINHVKKFQNEIPKRVYQITENINEMYLKIDKLQNNLETLKKFVDGMDEFVDYKFGVKMNEKMKNIFLEDIDGFNSFNMMKHGSDINGKLLIEDVDMNPCYL